MHPGKRTQEQRRKLRGSRQEGTGCSDPVGRSLFCKARASAESTPESASSSASIEQSNNYNYQTERNGLASTFAAPRKLVSPGDKPTDGHELAGRRSPDWCAGLRFCLVVLSQNGNLKPQPVHRMGGPGWE
ncbi:arabinosyl transferase C [Anopheles sinensis]|uniref:Arabinosyl transferase C n=1 Tax=Anopheles sinensis TaxID=74873 RepID=A0A084VBI0_ANOSI|nr:arabinosyl transferase C [Anopheles sinensis]